MEAEAEVRLAEARDAAGIREVAHRTWEDTYAGIILPENQERLLGKWYSREALQQAIGQSHSWLYVAVAEGEVIGFSQFVVREAERGELTRIYVLPEWQRRRTGSRLLKQGIEILSEHGADELFVHAEKDNAKATAFYERTGFRQVRGFSVELPGQSLQLLEYVLSLRSE